PFRAENIFLGGKAGNIPARPRQALNIASADRIRDLSKHDGHRAGGLLQRRYGRGAGRQDDVRRERDQFRRVSTDAVGIARAPAIIDPYVTPDYPAQFLQPLQECSEPGHSFRIVRGQVHEHTDAPRTLALLRACRERPRCCRAAEKRDEVAAAHYSITSSTLASSCGGTSRPSALAVCRLMTNSNFVDCSTGRAAGLGALRI